MRMQTVRSLQPLWFPWQPACHRSRLLQPMKRSFTISTSVSSRSPLRPSTASAQSSAGPWIRDLVRKTSSGSQKKKKSWCGEGSGILFAFFAAALLTSSAAKEDTEKARRLTEERDALPIVRALRADADRWSERDPYFFLEGKPAQLHRNLSAGTLSGDGMYALRPLLFVDQESKEAIAIIHIGERMCGHDGIVHGGLLATICDEMLAVVTLPHFPSKTGFTANLNINYRQYVPADRFIVARASFDRIERRKAFAKVQIESADGKTVHVETSGLYVTPKSILSSMLSWR